ncbi:MAG: CD1871A family CXXC motif-containing protein [Eubacteriales bacterium]|nr:CD1871A family CXXC motif-containing protein [Eubacteriales bacterium]
MKNRMITIALLVVGAGFILLGLHRNEVATVLRKAIVVCLECVGIG